MAAPKDIHRDFSHASLPHDFKFCERTLLSVAESDDDDGDDNDFYLSDENFNLTDDQCLSSSSRVTWEDELSSSRKLELLERSRRRCDSGGSESSSNDVISANDVVSVRVEEEDHGHECRYHVAARTIINGHKHKQLTNGHRSWSLDSAKDDDLGSSGSEALQEEDRRKRTRRKSDSILKSSEQIARQSSDSGNGGTAKSLPPIDELKVMASLGLSKNGASVGRGHRHGYNNESEDSDSVTPVVETKALLVDESDKHWIKPADHHDNQGQRSEISNEALNLETRQGQKVKKAARSKPRLRRINTMTSCAPLSRNAKTAPSTPEAECRAPPRHAESTSQLEISTGLGKRTNGLTSIKGLETSLEKADQLHQPPQPSGKALHPHKELSPKMNKSRNDKFHKIFKTVPEKEIVLKSYLCAYVGDILLQGYLYVSPNYFCFYTKILGHEKQLEIPVTEVVNITREKTAFIIPNAIGVLTSRDKYVFGSLMSRDSTYRLMVNVWKKTNPGPAVYNQTVTDSDLSADDDKDYFDASDADGHKLSDDLHNADSLSDASDDDDTSICSECGTPMAEHTPGNTCDNSPNTQTTIPEATAQEGFDQVDGPRRAPAVMSSSSPATGATGRKLSRSHRSVTEDGGRGHCLSSGEPAQTKWYSLSCTGLKNKYDWLNKKTSWAAGLPHTNLLLLTCLFIAVFLILSAGIMAYKILTLQAEIDHSLQWLDPSHARHARSQKLHSDLYGLNHKLHETTIERFHGVLEANIELLNEVHSSLHSLQNSPILKAAMDCPPPPIVSDDNS